jgi:CRISPR/Cas system CMR subunit Cmr4 (Cas7 group RAMP superfamily)
MGIADTIYTFRFLKILSTKWEDTDAYKYGIIDENGVPLKKSKDLVTQSEKDSYTSFIRLIFKLKRLMGTVPGGKSAVARYGAALALLKENKQEVIDMDVDLDKIKDILHEKLLEEVTNTTAGIDGKEEPINKKKDKTKVQKRNPEDEVVAEDDIHYQLIGNVLIRVDEQRREMKKRVHANKRLKKREFVPTDRKTRTGRKKLRGSAKSKWKRSHRKAYRKAHNSSATRKRKKSMKKSIRYNK